jgi:formylglycine-generating enzyme required for sulfatase activity
MIFEIATKKNLNDILERFDKLTVNIGCVAIEMILVKGYQDGNFYIGKYPVTQTQWRAVMGGNPSHFEGEDNPVDNVSWNDCQDFIKKLNSKTDRKFRLPKEFEWVFAARGGNKTHNYKYSGSNKLDEVGWYLSNSWQQTHPVGQKKPNELGIYDMSGNVWEWCENLCSSSEANRVVRGGSCGAFDSYCAVACRINYLPDSGFSNYGFRLAMDA